MTKELDAGALEAARKAYYATPTNTLHEEAFEAAIRAYLSAAKPTPTQEAGEVERAARAIAASMMEGDPEPDPEGNGWRVWEKEARAVIAALATPDARADAEGALIRLEDACHAAHGAVCDQMGKDASPSDYSLAVLAALRALPDASADAEGALRAAYAAGYWEWFGPANGKELEQGEADIERGWQEYRARITEARQEGKP